MRPAPRPSDVHGRPGVAVRPLDHPEPAPAAGAAPGVRRWRMAAATGLAVLLIAGLAAPGAVGEGGVLPAELQVVSREQAVIALVLHRAHDEAREALTLGRDLTAPPGPGVALHRAGAAHDLLRRRLDEARALSGADPAARAYWSSTEHDVRLAQLDGLRRDAEAAVLLAAAHETLYGENDVIPLAQAEQELVSRYATGTVTGDSPLARWGRALLAELEGADARADADQARAAADTWWDQEARALAPPATAPLRAYLGGLPGRMLLELETDARAGPGLAALRAG